MSSIGCFLSSLRLWRLRQDAFSRVSQPAKSGFNRRIVSLIDQKFDDEPASYDRDG